jgi:hypothetical protein
MAAGEPGAALSLSNGHGLGRLSGRCGERRRAASRRGAGVPKQLGQALDAALLPEHTQQRSCTCHVIRSWGEACTSRSYTSHDTAPLCCSARRCQHARMAAPHHACREPSALFDRIRTCSYGERSAQQAPAPPRAAGAPTLSAAAERGCRGAHTASATGSPAACRLARAAASSARWELRRARSRAADACLRWPRCGWTG